MSGTLVKPHFHSVSRPLKEREEQEQELWFYLQHIQLARTLTEIARELRVSEHQMIKWANDSEIPVFNYDQSKAPYERHEDLPKSTWDRPPRADFFMEVAVLMSKRATCLAGQYGAVITVDNRIVTTGYNGAPQGKYHCTDVGVCRKELMGYAHFDNSIPGQTGAGYEASRSVHAEAAAICQAARMGLAIEGGNCYVNREPCVGCHRLLINCGIDRIYYLDGDEIKMVMAWDRQL